VWPLVEKANSGIWQVHEIVLNEFFAGDRLVWDQFVHSVRGRVILDVGSGPVPIPALWPSGSQNHVIDPLAEAYDAGLRKHFGRSWFDGMVLHSVNAECNLAELNGKIDGAIVCRNCLDHCAEPYLVLANLASYAASGCHLLLWTDLHHPGGRDQGHRNITADVEGFRRLVENLGFYIQRETPESSDRKAVSFG